MRTSFFAALIICLVTSIGQASELTRYHLRGKGATANWWQWTGYCTAQSVYLVVSDDKYREDHKGKSQDISWETSTVHVDVVEYDLCNNFTQRTLINADAALDAGAFKATDLKAASLWAIIPAYERNGQPIFLTLDIEWAGTDVIYTGRSNSFFAGPGFTIRNSYNGRTRVAETWGTITNGVKKFVEGPASWGDIHNIRSGYVDVIK